ncbi:NAD-dependent epimerase/dehydratase family protein [Actinoplanes solisilvae]|uniref:NAD-dependent epimerase/dehydratase family protein n=1 Tax=Actinoplanes solisilvae TaxID=2486853 RepID=UPI000FDBD714|nr:NAD-dependent epimerase/dehydratase family protein [Actinoplanes solisilvae]
MRLLILGGSGFVGRAVADEGVRRGFDVTVFNRGLREAPAGVSVLVGDRQGDLTALGGGTWDAVVDTWSAEGEAVRRTAQLLSGRAGHYAYVSSRSVYTGASPRSAEDAPVVDETEQGYAGDKRRGELGAAVFDGPVLLARAGLILGPYEDVGRLPWWLNRLARGGPTLAPGPRDLPLQFIDVRDLANFLLGTVGRDGPFDLVSRPGHTTMGEFLEIANEVTGGRAELRWTAPEVIEAAGIEPWTQLPVYLPPGELHDFLHGGDTSKAYANGLVCRPVRATIEDTWAWLTALPGDAPQRADRAVKGLDPAVEAKVLDE